MSSRVDDIKEQICKLPDEEKVSLAAWLNVQTMDDWDRQMARDFSSGGRGATLLEQVKKDIAEGNFEPLDEGFARWRRNS